MRKILITAAIVLFDVVVLLALGLKWTRVRTVYEAQVGETVFAEAFLKQGTLYSGKSAEITYADGSTEYHASSPGTVQLFVNDGLFSHEVTVNVKDMDAPKAVAVLVSLPFGQITDAGAFVTQIHDETGVTVNYEVQPDWEHAGVQRVGIILEDEAGNCTELESSLFLYKINTEESYILEAGSSLPNPNTFLVAEAKEVAYLTDIEQIDTGVLGEHEVPVLADGIVYVKKINIIDTTPPVFTLLPQTGYVKKLPDAKQYVDAELEATSVSYSYDTEPVIAGEGDYSVSIRGTDSSGNSFVQQTTLTCVEDVEKPVFTGVRNIRVHLGDKIAYRKGVSAIDNCDGEIDFSVDAGTVNTEKKGRYRVVYEAVDSSGNSVRKRVYVTVVSGEEDITDDMSLDEQVDLILAEIITPEMSQEQICQAIYTYIKANHHYVSTSDKSSYEIAAADLLKSKKGDCFSFASISKVMLTRAGITNMDIIKIPAETNHYWNLVDIGEGWLHFDTTPRADKKTIFLMTEEELLADEAIAKSHNYDRESYPLVKQH